MSEKKILMLMLKKQGEIIRQGSGIGTYAVIPRGDKRCRPAAWLDRSVLESMLSSGTLVKKKNNYILASSYKRRAEAGKNHGLDDAFANQHRHLETRDIYHPDGIMRPTRINRHLSVFYKLAVRTNKDGRAFLSPDEIEAGECFAADFSRSQMASVTGQNYGAVSGGNKVNIAENISISALDARQRVMDALEIVGPGLDSALTGLCGHDMTLVALETSENWAKGAGKTVLKLALSRLSAYYGCQAGVKVKRSSQ